jgi:hypothetical protein
MRRLFLFLLIAGSGAAWWYNSNTGTNHKVMIDPLLKPYVKDWCYAMEQAGIPWEERLRSIHSFTLEYYDEGSKKTGLTSNYSHKITINRWFIDRNPCALRATVFHELGHAAFELPHECCFIMNATTDTHEQNYCDNWNSYLSEYITQCRKYQNE